MICEPIDWRSPYAAFAPLAGTPHAHLLHAGDLAPSQWSTIVAFPEDVITANVDDGAWLAATEDVTAKRAASQPLPTEAPFHCGLVGYVGYEALGFLEPTLDMPPSPYRLPEAVFGVYNASAVFNRDTRESYVVGCDEDACRRLKDALGEDIPPPPFRPVFAPPQSTFTREAYQRAVAGVIERIRNGDFYQANIAQVLSLEANAQLNPFDVFRMIAEVSDAKFGALLQYHEGAIISNSPERFFRVDKRRIIAEPVKGTRGREVDPRADAAAAAALAADPKERAENIMIADLMRNDLSKICEDGSISEDAICDVMSLARVHHLVSTISGKLRDAITIADVFRALFPSGSITGAPKIEAMKSIAEIEQTGRGPYCGAIGYIDDSGGADFSVSIRTMMLEGSLLSVPVGGGVTLRSDPGREYDETLIKARGVLDVLLGAASRS